MQPFSQAASVQEIIVLLAKYRRRFFWTAGIIAGVAVLVACIRSNRWEASQALIVRNEAIVRAAHERPGRFDRPEQMQSVQETILELARSRAVLLATLVSIGPSENHDSDWPTEEDIESLREAVRITPPKGAEYGSTEVFYVKVTDNDRQRSVRLAATLCKELRHRHQQLLDEKAQSMIDELARTVSLANTDLDASTERLRAVEIEVGSDLSELRVLERSPSGVSDLRTQLATLEAELREARQGERTHEALRELIVASRLDAGHLLAAPNRLLESQPALRRLKDGLVDAQLRTAQMRGSMSDKHPRVLGAIAAEEAVRTNLSAELESALHGIEVELKLTRSRAASLADQIASIHGRLKTLAGVRARYGNLIEEIHQRQQILKVAEENLADARATQAAALSTSLICVIDTPDTGSAPLGPSRLIIAVGGVLGGLVVGLGIVLLTATPGLGVSSSCESSRPTAATAPSREPASSQGVLSLKGALAKLARRRISWN